MYNILVPYFTRSEYAPLEPLFKMAEKHPFNKMLTLRKHDMTLIRMTLNDRPAEGFIDMVLCGFDRPEMAEYAYMTYHNTKVPICQIFAGDIAGGAFDDRDRFVISNYADLIFAAGKRQYERVKRAVQWRTDLGVDDMPEIILSGATHYDDMTCTQPKGVHVPVDNYALVLYNRPSTISIEQMKNELTEMAIWLVKNHDFIYWAHPNGDEGSREILEHAGKMRNTTVLPQMSRAEFLWVLSNAKVFVGNSSALFYEAPYFLRPIRQFGVRNQYREALEETHPGASACILSNIYNYLEERK